MNAPAITTTTQSITEALADATRRAELAELALAEAMGLPVTAIRGWLANRYAKRLADQAVAEGMARFARGTGTREDLEAITARAEGLGFAYVQITVLRYSRPTDGCVRLDGVHGPPSARDMAITEIDRTHVRASWATVDLRRHLRMSRGPGL